MSKEKKITFLSIALSFVILVGVSFAFFYYQRISNKNVTLITGEIYLHLNDGTDSLTLTNAFPETVEEARARDDNVLTFTIDGKNTTTNKDIWYEIDLVEGDDVEGRTRIDPRYIKFDLIEIEDGVETMVVDAKNYGSIDSKLIHINTVNRNTTAELVRTYKLRVWFSDEILISDSDESATYTTSEWKDIFASIKVKVQGDFDEKEYTPSSCFATEVSPGLVSLNTNLNTEQINTCVSLLTSKWGAEEEGNTVEEGETYEAFCNGTGTNHGETFQSALDNGWFEDSELSNFIDNEIVIAEYNATIIDYDENCGSDVVIPRTIKLSRPTYGINPSMDVSACVNYFTTIWGEEEEGNNVDVGETYEAFCNGTGTNWGETFENVLKNNWLDNDTLTDLENEGIIIENGTTFRKAIVTIIEDGSFNGKGLTSVDIPNTVVEIKGEGRDAIGAFASNQLASVTIPNSVTEIGGGAFGDNKLKNITLPNSITTIDWGAFSNNQLTSVAIPNSIVSIQSYAFSNNQLQSLDIPNGVTSIGGYAFSDNQLTNVTIGNNVTTIGKNAFENNQLTSVVIPNSVISIQSKAFGNNNITSLSLGRSGFVDLDAFDWSKIEYLDIPAINDRMFWSLSDDKQFRGNLILGNSVTTIGESAFKSNQLTSVVIGNNVTTIGKYAFEDNQLTNVTIPNSVTEIGSAAFSSNQLASVKIPNSVTTIGNYAFSGNQLTNVEIPNSVIEIGGAAFSGNQLTSVTIGNGVTAIDYGAFAKTDSSNPNLTSITIDRPCSTIKTGLLNHNNVNYYPWLSNSSPYIGSYAAGTTIYGSNGEVCDSW